MSVPVQELVVRIDFDLTLSNSKIFHGDLWDLVARNAGVTSEEVKAQENDFTADPVLGGYNFDAHTAAHDLDPEFMWRELEDLVRDSDYLFEDSGPFVDELIGNGFMPRILSFGEDRFQRTKIAPAVKRLASNGQPELGVDVVLRKKGEHIADQYPGRRGTLVDDVRGQNLPDGFVEIHLDRLADHSGPIEISGGFTVANLEQTLEVIKSI